MRFVKIISFLLIAFLLTGTSCRNKQKAKDTVRIKTTLFDKELPEIKKMINGKWELVSGKNSREVCEYENTFIEFNDDKYIWTEDGKQEPGELNWRKADTGIGYDAYLMDVFYETNPAYPLLINGDTLILQDCSQTGYKYTLIRK
ncbi:hypothetical protein [Parabacteroides sp. AM08-6]|uniref:hypothetical protein n=1 Tax=Parabacteroides sp. AM08-6 TaxID=2292053 RepID=UPI000EFE1FB3|nr:hypothetical protein [Parabacteroides sp. AM08-6]RHJ82909.1 hypothetical protein DW103_08120 [Parabacteroides sp. AM08-6]